MPSSATGWIQDSTATSKTGSAFTRPLDFASPYFPKTLIAPVARERLSILTDSLPPHFSRMYALECPLHSGTSFVDISVNLSSMVMRGLRPKASLPSRYFETEAWSKMRTFCRTSGPKGAPLRPYVSSLGLEFDADTIPTDPPIPAFFCGLNVPSSEREQSSPSHSSERGDGYRFFFETALPILLGTEPTDGLWSPLESAIDALPTAASIRHVGVMFSRDDALRLCVQLPSPDAAYRYLQNIDWPGSVKALRRSIDATIRPAQSVTLALDVGRAVGPRLGFECRMQPSGTVVRRVRQAASAWAPYLALLEEQNLCTAEERIACTDWISARRVRGLESEYGALVTSLNHVKIVYRPDAPPHAKVYLYVYHQDLHENR